MSTQKEIGLKHLSIRYIYVWWYWSVEISLKYIYFWKKTWLRLKMDPFHLYLNMKNYLLYEISKSGMTAILSYWKKPFFWNNTTSRMRLVDTGPLTEEGVSGGERRPDHHFCLQGEGVVCFFFPQYSNGIFTIFLAGGLVHPLPPPPSPYLCPCPDCVIPANQRCLLNE